MKTRDILIGIGLLVVALAVFLWPEGETEGAERVDSNGNQTTRSEGGQSGASEAEGGRALSDRVLREESELITTASGLQYQVFAEGKGEHPTLLSDVLVHYEGTLEDGTVFDSSRERGQPSQFGLHAVIKGWGEGLQLMKPGATYRFVVPPELAYGNRGAGELIPPDATLIFEVELISIVE